MAEIMFQSLFIFSHVLEVLLLIFVLCTWLIPGRKITIAFYHSVEPMLRPVRFLLRHSSFQTNIDLSPLVVFVVLSFLQKILRPF